MKRRFAIISALAALLIAGCGSAPKIYDPSVPLEQSSTLRIVDCAVIEFNGQAGLGGVQIGETQVIIPAGTHTLKVLSRSGSTSISTWTGDITYQFLPGQTYYITISTIGSSGKILILNTIPPMPDPSRSNASQVEGIWVNTAAADNKLIFAGNEYFTTAGNGKLLTCGTFTFDGRQVTLSIQAYTMNGGKKWMHAAPQGTKIDYDGATLRMGRNEYRR